MENDGSNGKRYLKKDLIDQAEISNAIKTAKSYGNRAGWIKAALPEDADVQKYLTGGYQGQFSCVIRLNGEIWLFNDFYGSCGHCDNFIDRKEEWLVDMLERAYCFKNEEDALAYLANSSDYSWNDIKEQTAEMIENPEKNKMEDEA